VPQGYQPPQVQEEDVDTMNAASIEALVQAALAQQEQRLIAEFQNQISAVNQQLQSLRVEAPEVETYQRKAVNPIPVPCDIPLHIVKSIPDFPGYRMNRWRGGSPPQTPMSYSNHIMAVTRITRPLQL